MFLIKLLIATPLFAQSSIPLEKGVYHLQSGKAEICGSSVEILKEDLAERRLEIGHMVFNFKVGTTTIDDKALKCTSHEKVNITSKDGSMLLERNITDQCKEGTTHIQSRLELSAKKITLKQTDVDSYSCQWVKK